mmetsp:Transcript_932/g.2586  ORF Transcript_932/g.2586 Transcript_932/m.2586 type:complete len:231 (-) Transcript_932:207-899(-)
MAWACKYGMRTTRHCTCLSTGYRRRATRAGRRCLLACPPRSASRSGWQTCPRARITSSRPHAQALPSTRSLASLPAPCLQSCRLTTPRQLPSARTPRASAAPTCTSCSGPPPGPTRSTRSGRVSSSSLTAGTGRRALPCMSSTSTRAPHLCQQAMTQMHTLLMPCKPITTVSSHSPAGLAFHHCPGACVIACASTTRSRERTCPLPVGTKGAWRCATHSTSLPNPTALGV